MKLNIKKLFSLMVAVFLIVLSSTTSINADSGVTTKVTNLNVSPNSINTGTQVAIDFDLELSLAAGHNFTENQEIALTTNIGDYFSVDWDGFSNYPINIVAGNVIVAQVVVGPQENEMKVVIKEAGVSLTHIESKVDLGQRFVPKPEVGSAQGTPAIITIAGNGETGNANVTFVEVSIPPENRDPRAVDQDRFWKNGWDINAKTMARFALTVNPIASMELYQTNQLVNNKAETDLIVEDTIPNQGEVVLNSLTLQAVIPNLVLSTGKGTGNADVPAGQYYAGEQGSQWLLMNQLFEQVSQTESEDYQTFKARITPLKWGVYKDSNKNNTLVINFGPSLGDNITLDRLNYNISNSLLASKFNLINNNVVSYRVEFSTVYQNDNDRQPLTNQATLNFNGVNIDRTTNFGLDFGRGFGVGNSGTVRLGLYDESSVQTHSNDKSLWQPIAGAQYKLQYFDGITQQFTDTQYPLATTDSKGFIEFAALAAGKYKLVQTATHNAYSIDNESYKDAFADSNRINQQGEFIINVTDQYGVSVIATNPRSTTTVTVNKVWVNAPEIRPAITVQLYRDGVVFGDAVMLDGSETIPWSYTWSDLEKTTDAGVAYQFTVDEIDIPENYRKMVSNYTITNTYISPNDRKVEAPQPGDDSEHNTPPTSEVIKEMPIESDIPKTGVNSHPEYWAVMLLISGLILIREKSNKIKNH